MTGRPVPGNPTPDGLAGGGDGLLLRVRRLFRTLVGLVIVVEIVEWFDATTPLWPQRTVAAAGFAAAMGWALALYREGRPVWWLDATLAGTVVITGWGLGRNGAVIALMLGALLFRAMYGRRRSVIGATGAVLAAYVLLTYLTGGVERVVDLGVVTVAVGLAAVVGVLRVVAEAMARHDLAACWDRALTRCAGDLLSATDVDAIDTSISAALGELRRSSSDASGGLISVPVIPPSDPNDAAASRTGVDEMARSLAAKLERLSADARLARERIHSEERYRQLAEGSRDGIYLRSLEDPELLVYLNPGAQELLHADGRTGELDLAAGLSSVHPEDHATIRRAVAEHGYIASPVRVRLRGDGADPAWIELEEVAISSTDGRPRTVQGTIRDVTRQRREEEALRDALESQRAAADQLRHLDGLRATFLSAVSHELRTPLAAVLGSSQTLVHHHDRLSPAQTRSLMDAIHRQATRLQRLLDDLLDVERLSRGLIEPHRTPTDLRALIVDVVATFDTAAGDIRVVGEHVTVEVDAPQVERIVDNLVRNALKHTPAGTRVRVGSHRHRSGALLIVEDDGPGIPEALRQKLFEPFEQGPDASLSASPGTGIGLSLVARLAELHGGRAWVEEADDGGARFLVLLPTAPAESDDDPRLPAATAARPAT